MPSESDGSDSLLPAVHASLAAHRCHYKVLACDTSLADTQAFCEHYGYSLEQSANTILIANRRDAAQVVACVVLADSRLDVNKTVSRLMNAKKVSFATAEQTVLISGMEIGGVTIFGLPDDMPVYIDARVLEQSEVIMGGGNRSSKVAVPPIELQKLPNVQVVEGLAQRKEAV